MSFWDTFVKVWQVRKSIEIQEGIEGWFRTRQRQRNSEQNIEDISREVIEKNGKWNIELERKRRK
ncbi:MAG: hypothetical protein EBR35_06205 [Flavobacteriales bacterium]|jgi:hypothetical protein|nr:hypothetical protein [Flavobacteriales bacterium]NDA99102.1 hypothetical protein [Flavobacteriia bacterium]NDC28543.1 hypothetical protein [Crocinitomicaceae bacterium]NDC93449.1 hypothetical protein [Flavobacteriales bacterium]